MISCHRWSFLVWIRANLGVPNGTEISNIHTGLWDAVLLTKVTYNITNLGNLVHDGIKKCVYGQKRTFFLQWYIFPKKYNFFYIAPMYLSSTIFQHYKLISSHFHPKYALRPYFQILTQSPRKCPKCQENPFRPHGHTQRIFHLSVIFPERKWHSNLNSKVLDLLDRKVHLQWSSASCATPPPRLARFPGEKFWSQKSKWFKLCCTSQNAADTFWP